MKSINDRISDVVGDEVDTAIRSVVLCGDHNDVCNGVNTPVFNAVADILDDTIDNAVYNA